MNSHALFTQRSPRRLFFFAAIPGAVSMLASALYQLVDGIFVGQFLGETAFAALNLAMPFTIINFALADLIGSGSAVPISVAIGRKEDEKANNIFTCSCLMIVGAGVVMGALLYALAPTFMALMGADGAFAEYAVQYLRVYALCSPVTTINFAMDNYLRICRKVGGSMSLNVFMSILSAGLEFLFLFVLEWGIAGAALGTCLGMFVCSVIALIPFLRGNMQLRFCKPRFRLSMIREIVACGSPNFLNNIAGRITSILMNFLLVRLGTSAGIGGETAVSIYGILMYVEGFIQPLLYGTCDSLQPAIGCNWGAKKYSRVKAIEKYCFTGSAVISLLAVVVILLFPAEIASLFMKETDAASTGEAVAALRLFAFTCVTRWFSFATQSYMLAVEKPLQASIISVSTALVFPVLLIAALWTLGLQGIWLNFAGTSVLAGILSLWILLRFRREMQKKMAEQEPATLNEKPVG